ncbi:MULTISPECIES: DNA N-6-adenine-methyltransferase [Xanthomonas]|uniref:Phage N-6-adenine-methyltransferase n=1 Tax=Xanthomonas dyei TaxID=743699 RepID=A0ABZ0DC95_9XANT|nr:DNA N-6-adenine-methyltransferase [Xanthomonas dyei]WOB27716.1 phage N-6-adenine-methyltransferase [Xanthomonas dyei]WOB55338.1 phage N-6-adenine-methyltransferase [Xanthomonas dyei]
MNAANVLADHNALSLPKARRNTSSPRATKLASAMVGYDRLPAAQTTDTWLTPPELIWGSPRECFTGLGPFDLDPCTPEDMPWPTANRMLTPIEDGLATPWPADAFVFMNPPFGRGQDAWMQKLANHPSGGIALVFARTDTAWFQDHVLNHPATSAIVFQRGRLKFCRQDGTPGDAPPCGPVFVAYGEEAARRLRLAVSEGQILGGYLDMARVGMVAGACEAANDE